MKNLILMEILFTLKHQMDIERNLYMILIEIKFMLKTHINIGESSDIINIII